MKVGSCNLSGRDREQAIRKYTALHEGLMPERFLCEPWHRQSVSKILGVATEIQYKKKIPDGVPSYHHPWAAQAQPKLAIDKNGIPIFYAGKYETTRRGIEDRVTPGMPTVKYLREPHVQPERLPPVPTGLITLGRLEWIKYKSRTRNGRRVRTLRFPDAVAPEIAHDQDGNLHVLTGVEESMASHRSHRSRRHHAHHSFMRADDNPSRHSRRGHRGRRHHARRHNPTVERTIVSTKSSDSMANRAGRMILDAGIVGAVGTVSAIGLDIGIAKLVPTWSIGAKALTKIGAGFALGLLSAYALPKAPQLAAGIAVGGAVDGLRNLYDAYAPPSLTALTVPSLPATTTVVTTPAGQALMPGGIPQGYQAYSPAACGVR